MLCDSEGRRLEVKAYSNPGRRSLDFYVADMDPRQVERSFATFDEGWRVVADNAEPPVAFRLDCHNAQLLMDSLWDCGLRPSEGKGSASQLAAVENHLRDMRTLAFATRELTPPEPKR